MGGRMIEWGNGGMGESGNEDREEKEAKGPRNTETQKHIVILA